MNNLWVRLKKWLLEPRPREEQFSDLINSFASLPLLKIDPPRIGQRVAVHNWRIGEFLESWNGQTGIVINIQETMSYIQLDGHPSWVSAVGFPHGNLLPLKGDLAEQPQFVTPNRYGKQTLFDEGGRMAIDEEDTLSQLRYIEDHADAERYFHDCAPYNQSLMHYLARRGFVAVDCEQSDGGRRVKITDAGIQHLKCAMSAGYSVK